MPASEFPPIESLMPHRDRVVLLDRVLRHDGDSTDVAVSIAKIRWLNREDGSVAGWLAIEFMAQCVAAHEGLLASAEGRPPPAGFLIGVNALRLDVAEFAADDLLCVTSRRFRGRPSLGALSHQCEIRRLASGAAETADGDHVESVIAEGRLSVSVPRDAANERSD